MTAYLAMIEYQDCTEFMNEVEELAKLLNNSNAEVKDDNTMILSLSRDDYHRIKMALYKSNKITCSYKDTICKMMENTDMPDTLV